MVNKFFLCLILFFFLAGGCVTTRLAPLDPQGFQMEEDERRLWTRSEEDQKKIEQSGLRYADADLEAYLNEIARRLQPPEIQRHIPFQIKIIKNPLLNAFAYPNGKVYLHTGILARVENEAQLATILAHEMSHCTLRHLVKEFRDRKNKTAFMATLGTVSPLAGDLPVLLGELGAIAAITGYSRELETEADREGIKRLADAGYDLQEAPKVFKHLKEELEEEKIKEPFFFGTHPRLAERIKNCEEFILTESRGKSGTLKNTELYFEKSNTLMLHNALLDLRLGRYGMVQRCLDQYLKRKPGQAVALHLLGESHRQRNAAGDLDKAKAWFLKAIDADPAYADPCKSLGLVFYKQGDKETAKRYFQQYLTLAPTAPDRAYIEQTLKLCDEGGAS